MNKLTPIFIAGAIALSAGLAVAQNQLDASGKPPSGHHSEGHGAHGSHGGHETAAPSSTDAPSTAAFRKVNERMHADMAVNFTGDADADFLRGMIPHHQGAVDMARVVLQYGKDPKIKALAEDIIRTQEGEISLMMELLAARGK